MLGALTTGPMSGYAVRAAIRDVLGHFWSESYGQIYPTLRSLEQSGLVDRREPDGAFAITASGRERLLELLSAPARVEPARNGLLLRLFFGEVLGAPACRALLVEARDRAREQLDRYEAIEAGIATEPEHASRAPYWRITLGAGRHGALATIAWAEESLRALEEQP